MKKFRPIKLWIMLLGVSIVGITFGVFFMDGWKRFIVLICSGIIFLFFIFTLSCFIQVKDDQIIIRHGLSSFNNSYQFNFKTRHILYIDIHNISINYTNKYVIITLNDGNNIMLSLRGYYSAYKILSQFENTYNNLNNKLVK